jgi:glycerol-3-phosphate dehydrogenase (NAD(P)+)
MNNVYVIGGGAWGTALAAAARRAGRNVTLYAHETEVVNAINAGAANPIYLPDVALPDGLRAVGVIADGCENCDAVILVVPAQFVRTTAQELAKTLSKGVPVVLAAKGIEQGSLALMTEIAEDVLPDNPLAVISGPSFAKEVASGLPAAVTLACADQDLGTNLINMIASSTFRIYQSSDLIGAEIGGSVKNVLAIACGVVEGRGLGDNARAALITRGLAEMMRLGRAKGATTETMMGLAGMGDLVLTCNAMQSRNFSFGFALGQGETVEQILASRVAVTEGVTSAVSVTELAEKMGVDMPICQAVNAILHQGQNIDAAIEGLMDRPLRTESE